MKRRDVLKVYKKPVCMVTHPCMPNLSGLARSRKWHLEKEKGKSFCNMKITDYIHKKDEWLGRDICKVCMKLGTNNAK